jgi:hypothetical protein
MGFPENGRARQDWQLVCGVSIAKISIFLQAPEVKHQMRVRAFCNFLCFQTTTHQATKLQEIPSVIKDVDTVDLLSNWRLMPAPSMANWRHTKPHCVKVL